MATLLVIAAVALLSAFLALQRWRSAFLLVLVMGLAQDVLRRVVSGQPVALVMLCVVVIAAALGAAVMRQGMISLRPITGGNRNAALILHLFLGWVLVQGLHGLLNFGTPVIPLIGVLSYLLPIPALWLAYVYVRDQGDVQRFLRLYVLVGGVAAFSVLMDAWGVGGWYFEAIGGELVVFDRAAGIVMTHGGLWRTSEVAAWHAGTTGCLAMLLLLSSARDRRPWWLLLILVVAVAAAILTGRRKVLAVIMAFPVLYLLGMWFIARRSRRQGVLILVMALAALPLSMVVLPEEGGEFGSHLARSGTVFEDAFARLQGMGLGAIHAGGQVGGWLGLGAGAGAQGTQHFAASGPTLATGSAEGGLGRITLELGLIGLILALAVLWAVARQARGCLRRAVHADPRFGQLMVGIAALLAANVPVFIGAAQVYGDPFVLILLGSMMGFVLAVPRVLRIREARSALRELGEMGYPVGLARDHLSPSPAATGLGRIEPHADGWYAGPGERR